MSRRPRMPQFASIVIIPHTKPRVIRARNQQVTLDRPIDRIDTSRMLAEGIRVGQSTYKGFVGTRLSDEGLGSKFSLLGGMGEFSVVESVKDVVCGVGG